MIERPGSARSFLRRAAAHLPDRAQLLLKQARVAAMPGDDWAASVARLRENERRGIDEIVRANAAHPDRKRVLILTLQQVPPWLEVSCGLAAALELRGHAVRTVLCDGLLPVCERNLGNEVRPPCTVCAGWLQRYAGAFGITFVRLTDHLRPDDREQAGAEIQKLADDGLAAYAVDGVPVGRLARRELQRHRRGYVFEPARDSAYREWLTAGAMLVRLAARLIDRERPDLLIASSGRTLMAQCFVRMARARGVPVVTWDTQPSHADGLVFSHDRPAVEVPLDDEWTRLRHQTLTPAEREALSEFLRRWSRSETTPYPYNPDPLEDESAIRAALGLRPEAPLIAAFANSAWDMKVVDRDVGFSSMFDWLFTLVDYAAAHPDIDVVIRAHPAESKTPPELQSRTPVASEIRRRYATLPGNLRLVPGESPVSSYSLARMADVAAVYSSRIGLEIALMGKRPWVAGDVTYRGKGFTLDLATRDEMRQRLDRRAFDGMLSADEVALAERFAYLWFFRYVTRLPLLCPPSGRFRLDTFAALAPGGDPVIDRVCDALIEGSSFVDLNLTGAGAAVEVTAS